jgi:hypothetical protein
MAMKIWGLVPAAGLGSRIQPLAFSKELLPVGSRFDGGTERPPEIVRPANCIIFQNPTAPSGRVDNWRSSGAHERR